MNLTIEKLVYGGEGLARLPGDEHGRGKAVFVPFVLAGERVDVNIVDEKAGFARASLQRVIEASAHRTPPPCPYFTRCGGCHYQHSGYEQQLQIKASILKENLRRLAKLELAADLQIHASPPWHYRNRTRMRVQAQDVFVLGYNRFGSHDVEPVEQCPISSPMINQAITAVWKLGREGKLERSIREIEFFASHDDSRLLLEIYCGGSREQARVACEVLQGGIAGCTGVAAFPTLPPQDFSNYQDRAIAQAGAGALEYSAAECKYRVSAGSFFQTNRHLVDKLLNIVTGEERGRSALDLYAGAGLFAAVLACRFDRVTAVESSPQSFADLEYNSRANVKAVRAAVENYLQRCGRREQVDLAVVDPPRGGLGGKVVSHLVRLQPRRLIYVSCDPATLARDVVPLLAAGYQVEQAHLVDLFPQTFHIESVLKLGLQVRT